MSSPLPTRVLAGVTVPDTPLIAKAIAFARAHCDDFTYNHVMRSWLFGQVISDAIPDFASRDAEVHAISAILHDLGWSANKEITSQDKRFEVDGANATREFLIREGDKAEWDKHRLQLAWDSIALHSTPTISMYKETEVKCCGIGIFTDLTGPEKSPGGVLTRKVWNGVVAEFPRLEFRDSLKNILCGLCLTKPETTYDNFVSEFGVAFVDGYKPKTFFNSVWANAEA